MRYLLIVFMIFPLSEITNAQGVAVVDFSALEKEIKKNTDTLYVVNFWATWCGPCVEEIKYFIQAQDTFKISKLKFYYVSLDMSKQKEKVEQFIKKKGMKGKYYLLKDDPNNYINKIDKNWEGQIPFTLLVKPDKSYITYNAPFENFKQLKELIKSNLK